MERVIIMQRSTPPTEVRVIKAYLESRGCYVHTTGRSRSGFNAYRAAELSATERAHLEGIEDEYLAGPAAFRRKYNSTTTTGDQA